MSNNGIANMDDTPIDHTEDFSDLPIKSRLWLFVIIVVVIASLLIGFQAFGILYSIFFPPFPPLPPDTIEIHHENLGYGVDDWLYRSSDVCGIVQFYESLAGNCRIIIDPCDIPESVINNRTPQQVAICTAEGKFNIFAYRWEVNIAKGYTYENGDTQFRLLREIFWTGEVPPQLDPRTGLEFGN